MAATPPVIENGTGHVQRSVGDDDANLFRLGVEAAPSGLLMVDRQGVIKLVNRQIELMFGYDRDELIEQPVAILIPERFRGAHPEFVSHFMAAPTSRPMGANRELFGLRKDGSEFSVEIGLNHLNTSGDARILASIVDVSEHKNAKRELEARVSELQRQQEDMDLISKMSSLLQHTLSEREALDVVTKFGALLLPSAMVEIYEVPAARDLLRWRAGWGADVVATDSPVDACWAIRRSQNHDSGEVGLPACTHGSTPSDHWRVCIPANVHGQWAGMISLAVSSHELEKAEQRRIERIGTSILDQLALILNGLRLRESLIQQAIRDPLTSLYNRRHLEDIVEREIARSIRQESTLSVLMIDVDHFKRFNDTHGHQAGDDVLRQLGALTKNTMRNEDIICRFGGEEFVTVLPDCSLPDARFRAEQLQKAVAQAEIGVTLSIGVAEHPTDGDQWEAVLASADLAMYEAKQAGRDQVRSTSDL